MADALNHKYLAMMQLGIYDGEVIPSKRLEAYTMTFTYAEAGVELKFQHSRASNLLLPQSKTLGSAKQELRYLVHRLTRHIGGFPMLPRKKTNPHTSLALLIRCQLVLSSICTSRITTLVRRHISLLAS